MRKPRLRFSFAVIMKPVESVTEGAQMGALDVAIAPHQAEGCEAAP
jgi:hypothetical protein